jgi:hypothetical protein
MQQNVLRSLPSGVSRRWRVVIAVTFLALAMFIAASAVPPAQAGNTAQVYFVQGLPGRSVDIAVNGKTVAGHVAAAKIVGPLSVTAGTPTVTVREASGLIVQKRVKIAAGSNIDVVVHWPADTSGTPVLTWFRNDLSAVPAGKASLTVAHTALVGPADIRVNGKVLFANIANGEFITAEVPPDTYSVDIVPTGGSSPLLGPIDLDVKADALTRVFAIGQPKEGSMDAIVQVLPLGRGGSGSPGMVDAGSAGLVAPGRSDDQREGPQTAVAAVGVLAAAIVGAAIAAVRGARRRV